MSLTFHHHPRVMIIPYRFSRKEMVHNLCIVLSRESMKGRLNVSVRQSVRSVRTGWRILGSGPPGPAVPAGGPPNKYIFWGLGKTGRPRLRGLDFPRVPGRELPGDPGNTRSGIPIRGSRKLFFNKKVIILGLPGWREDPKIHFFN